MTKNRKSYGGLERCRNFRNLNESEPDARPVPVKVDPLQADAGATKWVAPLSLSAPPSAGPQVSRRGPGWRPVLRSARWQGQETLLLLNHAKKRDAPVDLRAFPWSLWPSLADAVDTPYRLLQDAQEFRPADESR